MEKILLFLVIVALVSAVTAEERRRIPASSAKRRISVMPTPSVKSRRRFAATSSPLSLNYRRRRETVRRVIRYEEISYFFAELQL